MRLLFNIASGIRRIYWFILRPKTIGVKCFIECGGEYLFIKHTYGSRTYNWNLPGGGVEKGESLVDAVRREVLEELGITLSEVYELKSYISSAEYKVDTIYCFYSKILNKDFVINKNEISEVRWFQKSNLPENLARSIRESLAALSN